MSFSLLRPSVDLFLLSSQLQVSEAAQHNTLKMEGLRFWRNGHPRVTDQGGALFIFLLSSTHQMNNFSFANSEFIECAAANGAGMFLAHQYNQSVYPDEATCNSRLQLGDSTFKSIWTKRVGDLFNELSRFKTARCARHSFLFSQLKFFHNIATQCGAFFADHMYMRHTSPTPEIYSRK